MIAAIAALTIASASPQFLPESRFQRAGPFAQLPWIQIDSNLAKKGIADSYAARKGYQARILWIDGTANMTAMSTDEGVDEVIGRAARAGFNVVVYDVKPIIGYTLYPSALTEKLERWRDQYMPLEFDALASASRAARKHNIELVIAMNALSEGHRIVQDTQEDPAQPFGDRLGPGALTPERQTVQYRGVPVVSSPFDPNTTYDIHPTIDPPTFTTPLAIYSRIPQPQTLGDRPWAIVDQRGRVMTTLNLPDALPAGTNLLVGQNEGAEFLHRRAYAGGRLQFKTRPVYEPITENWTQFPLMMNPHMEVNRDRVIAFVEEILKNYDVDGIMFDDRLRYGGLDADFDEFSRGLFEEHIGKQISWPDDVFKYTIRPNLTRGIEPGPYFDEWLAWRANSLTDLVKRTRDTVDEIAEERGQRLVFGVYAGSWYGDYARYGFNYASTDLDAGFSFLTRLYRKTGAAPYLDFLITGCYYSVPTVKDALRAGVPTGRTVEAGGVISNHVVQDQCFVYAGIMVADYWQRPDLFPAAMQAAAATTQGIMVFDYSHRIDEYWHVFERAFAARAAIAPHQDPEARATILRESARNPVHRPFPLYEGAPNAGF